MTRDQFRAAWNRLNDPVVEVGPGQQEGAAGSSYYTAPVTITDGARRLSGETRREPRSGSRSAQMVLVTFAVTKVTRRRRKPLILVV